MNANFCPEKPLTSSDSFYATVNKTNLDTILFLEKKCMVI